MTTKTKPTAKTYRKLRVGEVISADDLTQGKKQKYNEALFIHTCCEGCEVYATDQNWYYRKL